jgi:hypothetical protein
MSVTDEQIAQAQEFLTAWKSVTSRPMPAHVVDFASAIQEEAYKAGMASERERCASHLRASAARIAPDGKRTNQVDRHVADVLATKAAELSEVK